MQASSEDHLITAEFLHSARHDLRTPINHILGYTDLLIEGAEEGGYRACVADLRHIREAGSILLQLVDRLLDPTDLQVDSIDLDFLSHALRTPLNAVMGYSDLIQEEGAQVLPLDAQADLRKVYRAGATLVGLVSALLDLIQVEQSGTDATGRSTLFCRWPSAGAAESVDGEPGSPSTAGTLLVVDDNEMNRDLLGRCLARAGYAVAEVSSGVEALQHLDEWPTDLVLVDIHMPDMDGYEVCRRVRANVHTRMLPVVMVTASGEREKVRGIEAGADDFITTPLNQAELLARVRSLLRIKAYHDTVERQRAELAELNRTLQQRVQRQVDELERMGRLRRYLSPQVAKLVMTSGDETMLASHRRPVAVAFCDLRGFTAFAEAADAEEVMRVLREYHAALGQHVYEYEGTLERFAGDGIMIFFNDPILQSDFVERSVRMAVAMRERVVELEVAWRARGHHLGFGVGIAQGEATLGRIGFEARFDYAAIGRVTNLAARLCAEARAGQILISQRVHAVVADLVRVEHVGDLHPKGFSQPVPAYNVVELRPREPL